MRDAGRLSAAIEILADFDARRVPLKTAIADWARGARYAGAKDRAWISGLCLDALRRRRSLAAAMNDPSPRAAILGAYRWLWKIAMADVSAAAGEIPHGPGALTGAEMQSLSASALPQDSGDYPEWVDPLMRRVFGDEAAEEGRALAARADIDLRLNTLKSSPERALESLAAVGAKAHPLLVNAARIDAPAAQDRAPAVTIIPAFNKGWVEVQDAGSQIAAAAAGAIAGAQVLDFCAGGGGKTLALAALMNNTGQLYAYDDDARRLKPVYERAQRAGVRNLQIINPITDKDALDALAGRMDVVFVDAPCTGSGVWRRHPDTKWRLTQDQLSRRISEQDAALKAAAGFVRPGGALIYVTCSLFWEENEDRIDAFLAGTPGFEPEDAAGRIRQSGLMTTAGEAMLAALGGSGGALRLSPLRAHTDGFFIAALRRARTG